MTKKAKEVASNFGDVLIEALREAVATTRGAARPSRVSRRKLTAAHVEVVPPPRYRPGKIAAVRNSLGVSQPVFASMLNVSKSTVRAWEQGEREPDGATLRLLELAEKHPDVLTRTVQKKRVG